VLKIKSYLIFVNHVPLIQIKDMFTILEKLQPIIVKRLLILVAKLEWQDVRKL